MVLKVKLSLCRLSAFLFDEGTPTFQNYIHSVTFLEWIGIMFHKLRLFVLCVAFCAFIVCLSVIFLSNSDVLFVKNGIHQNLEKIYKHHDLKESYAFPLIRWRGGPGNYAVESGRSLVDRSPKYPFLRQQGLLPARKLPNALLIGVKKGGTRALLEFIRLHPDVRAAGSEVHFFDRHYSKGYDWYRQNMPLTLEGQITMEKTPSYFVMREVPQRVYQMNPAMKLLVVVRDPVTRAISDYTQVVSKNVSLPKFEDLVFRNGSQFGLVDTTWIPIKIGVYVRHLERWLKYFPLKQFHFVSGERLIVDPAAEISNVQEFLGLKVIISEKHFYFNTTKGFPCLKKSEGQSSHHCLGKTKGRSHPYIDDEVIERLREFYRPFNARFYQITGVNFGWP